jgi:hypothetical protein
MHHHHSTYSSFVGSLTHGLGNSLGWHAGSALFKMFNPGVVIVVVIVIAIAVVGYFVSRRKG